MSPGRRNPHARPVGIHNPRFCADPHRIRKYLELLAIGALAIPFFLSACAGPEYVYCRGQGSITLQGIYGGGVTVKCGTEGEDVMFYQGPKPPQIQPGPK